MEALRSRLRPTKPAPTTPLLTFLSYFVFLTCLLLFVGSAYNFWTETTEVAELSSTYQTGCEGTTVANVRSYLVINTSNPELQVKGWTDYSSSGTCEWSYETVMSDACSEQEEALTKELNVTLVMDAYEYFCSNTRNQTIFFQFSARPQLSFRNLLQCTLEYKQNGQWCGGVTSVSGIKAGPNRMCVVSGPGNYKCFPRENKPQPWSSYFSTPPLSCKEVATATPTFICRRQVSLSTFSVVSQAAAITSLAFTLLVTVCKFFLGRFGGNYHQEGVTQAPAVPRHPGPPPQQEEYQV